MRLRTLFISNVIPWPLDSGVRIRAYHLLRALAGITEVTLLSFTDADDGAGCLAAIQPLTAQVIGISRDTCRYRRDTHMPWSRRVIATTIHHCHPTRPVAVQLWDSPEASALSRHLSRQEFDIVWGQWLGSVPLLEQFPLTRRILNLNDVQYSRSAHRLNTTPFYLATCFDCIEFFKLRRFERSLPRLPWELVVCSEADKQALSGGGNVYVVPNGVDVPLMPTDGFKLSDEIDLLFIGEMSYEPNIDAAQYFVRSILPRIRMEIPHARFSIVGRDPAAPILTLHDGQFITVTGRVNSVQPYLATASLVVVPLRYGGGTRLKILEAMAHRKAVVSTTVGAEGLGLEAEKHVLIADTAEAFAQACLRALQSADLRKRLTSAAYQLVVEKYQWHNIEQSVQKLILDPRAETVISGTEKS